MPHKFNPTHMARLESEERRRLLDPDSVVRALALHPGETLLDLGCGPGFFSLPAAEAVGADGRVLAVDLVPQMLDRVRERAAERGLAQVVTVQSEESRVPVPDQTADALLLANVLHEADEPRRFLSEARRLLRPGGRLVVVDWKKEDGDAGPPMAERLAPETVREWLAEAGFESPSGFEPGPFSYGLIAVRR